MKLSWANGLRGIAALALLTGAAPAHGQVPPETATGEVAKEEPKIVAIRIVKENGQVLSDAPSGIAVETGNTLDRRKIAESLRALYRLGAYAYLHAVVTPVADAMRLYSDLRAHFLFDKSGTERLPATHS